MKLKEILSFHPFSKQFSTLYDIEINEIKMDSREITNGDLFVCINGFTVDGHDYVDEAIENGAVAIVAEKEIKVNVPVIVVEDTIRFLAMAASVYYHFPTNQVPLIGVTGTNGKTTITYLLDKIYNKNGKRTGIIGTIQMKIDDDIYPIDNTTPDTLFLQRMIRKMVNEKVDQVIMEVSSHALDQGRVYGCDYNIAVFTNLTQDHLDYHSSMDDYLRAKSLLFAQLGNEYHSAKKKFAIINKDDPASDRLLRSTAQSVVTYGIDNKAMVMAKSITLTPSGTKFLLCSPVGNTVIHSKLIGKFNVSNMLAASAAALSDGIPLPVIKDALETITGIDGRFELVTHNHLFSVIVDYAHTPDSLENVLTTIREFAKKKVFVVVGCGGDRDRTKRPLMANIALTYADKAIFTSDNPRTEDPKVIIDDMIQGLDNLKEKYQVIIDRKNAINYAIQQATEGDIILIAGKGHETYQQIGHTKYHFDDREIAKEALDNKEI
ncbi:UDP-N-acetylmuramoyl-L-alanyl-D-glutamate--2,6-diaminopimelate ligase [Ornithinibacillus halotolerans]|uniref:UDP-N-acetylmuramoyl-L-alanyl-D-glutamate--2,6-diaminopimelate ligase n=1 Tax=Ornithinibacillus halotolerans TaxID=1274357 RepID=A0A916S6U3_9BACI|nr:UDP-N-acetylmuramoyl-L-alanyl-D-glutamate--2,6-diaminopimelate ligase [Ornithinibacillus halotolerans]GGA83895.1 UDP-N-acetylmuramoyl-L-alanyl-D-glutamate--2,6-diaminopimelate ligase [Ornithinibacillus halotolerans]